MQVNKEPLFRGRQMSSCNLEIFHSFAIYTKRIIFELEFKMVSYISCLLNLTMSFYVAVYVKEKSLSLLCHHTQSYNIWHSSQLITRNS